jgi:hypothetical protein
MSLPVALSLIVIDGPSIAFSRTEAGQLASFMEAGGTVVLADDYGTGNVLLANLNTSVRFAGVPIGDLYFYSKLPTFPIVSHFTTTTLTENVSTVIMDHPTYLNGVNSPNVNVLATSSPFSFIDSLNNGTLPLNEKTESYPVIASIQFSRGQLILIANSYAFANEMIALSDNRMLFSNLLGTSNGRVAFDVAHLKTAPLTNYRITFRNDFNAWVSALHSTVTQLAVTTTLIAGFSIFYTRERTKQKRRLRESSTQSTLHSNQM